MFLLDTNVISELRKAKSNKINKDVLNWSRQQSVQDMFISSITILEIEMGILLKERKDPAQGLMYRSWLNEHVLSTFADRILSLDKVVALKCAQLHVPNPKSERDAMIAATALVHGLTLVTRNTKDFKHIKVKSLNPWDV